MDEAFLDVTLAIKKVAQSISSKTAAAAAPVATATATPATATTSFAFAPGVDNGSVLLLKPLGMAFLGGENKPRSVEDAAGYYWALLIRPLQQTYR
jgi:hypothetical protein